MWQIITLPLVGAVIGWITNVLAIRLIFRPYKAIVIPIINYRIQGVIPKRREELAKNVGKVIENELISLDDIVMKINETRIKEKVVRSVIEAISRRVDDRFPSWVPGSLKKIFINLIEDILSKEVPGMISSLLLDLPDKMKKEVDFSQIVEEKINQFDLHELERVIFSIASKELKHIEILGGVLGFGIGVIQALWFYLVQ